MNKYFLMLAAAGLIAAAPAYYAFQAHADEATAPLADTTSIAPSAEDEAAADAAEAPAEEAAPAAEATPAAEGAPAEEAPAEGTAQ